MSASNVSTNASASALSSVASWGFLPAFQVVCNILAFCGNAFVLGLFLRRPVLATPFNIYLMFLLSCNLLNAVTNGPLDVYGNLHRSWRLGSWVCTYYLYLTWLCQGFVGTVHSAITASRLWATFIPTHYRNHHTTKMAIKINLSLVLCALISVTPFIVLDSTIYRLPEVDHGCTVNTSAQFGYLIYLQLIYYDVAVLFPIAMYPLLSYKRFKRSHLRVRVAVLHQGAIQVQGTFYGIKQHCALADVLP